jgi:hypothetical protein
MNLVRLIGKIRISKYAVNKLRSKCSIKFVRIKIDEVLIVPIRILFHN